MQIERVNRGPPESFQSSRTWGWVSKSGRTISWAIPKHNCSNSGAGLLSGLIRVPQEFAAGDMARWGLAQLEEHVEELEDSRASPGAEAE
jgi:hypothetical protein